MNILNKQTIIMVAALFLWLAAIEIGFAKPPAGGAGHMQRGIELAQQKQYDAAIAEFTKAIQENPKDARGYTNRGTAYRASNRLPDAIADFSKAIEIAPKDEVAYRERGNAQVMQSQFDAALPDLDKAIELKPDDAYAYKFRGFAEIGLNQWDKAAADFAKAIELRQDDPLPRYRLALVQLQKGDRDAILAPRPAVQSATGRVPDAKFFEGLGAGIVSFPLNVYA